MVAGGKLGYDRRKFKKIRLKIKGVVMKRMLGLLLIISNIEANVVLCKRVKARPGKYLVKNDLAIKNGQYLLPELPYAYDSLEPYIDTETMKIHHTKHHQKYVDELNNALKKYPHLIHIPLSDLLSDANQIPHPIRQAVLDFGGGHLNHSLFWLMMTPNSTKAPHGILKNALISQFGTLEAFVSEFSKTARELFGSGWVWLCVTPTKKLILVTTQDQDNPISQGFIPLLGLDVWEHAYYLKHQNKRADYIDAWWHVVNWDWVEQRYEEAVSIENN